MVDYCGPGESCLAIWEDSKLGCAEVGENMVPSTNVRSTITEEGLVLMDVLSGKIFYGNVTAARVWLGIQQGLLVATMIDEISFRFGVSHEEVEIDVLNYIGSLKKNGLILEA